MREGAQSGITPLMSPETGLIHPSGITVGDARLLAVYSCACPPLILPQRRAPHV
jgi:hypothetical protein